MGFVCVQLTLHWKVTRSRFKTKQHDVKKLQEKTNIAKSKRVFYECFSSETGVKFICIHAPPISQHHAMKNVNYTGNQRISLSLFRPLIFL